MRTTIATFVGMPIPLRVSLVVLFCAILCGLAYVLFGSVLVVWVMLVGIAIVAMLVAGYLHLLKSLKRRKSAPMQRELVDNSSTVPQEVSDPVNRARLDDLSKRFAEGADRFRTAGKDIYVLPWYLLVGEPGSGKTEAVRNSTIRFPPGLNDPLQGAGGTLNMNWWFTDQAVILDTAGRLMFEEVQAGVISEWQAFLKLLLKYRYGCPVNGMLLVIPADSLISDSADAIERKAGKIARQFDEIQRVLGVRFPVFVLITKCDLINGFREFFDRVTDPLLQHQIVGWSNPAALDEPFDPDLIDQHLDAVRDRLRRRRLGLLVERGKQEDSSTADVGNVHAMYEFPDNLTRLGPRMKRYLETIFVAGEWSNPLFLRGIYFTSSMREGAALDADLAEMMNVPIESLEGPIWTRDRAFFLRDVFTKKVFRERGLVTRSTNTRALQLRRTGIVMGAMLVSLLVLVALTWFGAASLRSSIGKHRDYWLAVADRYTGQDIDDWSIVDEKHRGSMQFYYRGNEPLKGVPGAGTVAALSVSCQQMTAAAIDIPWVFRPAAMVSRLDRARSAALGRIYNAAVLWPVVDAARRKMRNDRGKEWSAAATGTLIQLARIEAIAAAGASHLSRESRDALIDLRSMFRYLLPAQEAEYVTKAQALPLLQQSLAWIDENRAHDRWPAAALKPRADDAVEAIDVGIASFLTHWVNAFDVTTGRWSAVISLSEGVSLFRAAEKKLLAVDNGYEKSDAQLSVSDRRLRIDQWRSAMADIDRANRYIDFGIDKIGDDLRHKPMAIILAEALKDAIVSGEKVFDELTDSMRLAARDEHSVYLRLVGQLEEHRQQVRQQLTVRYERALVGMKTDSADLLAWQPGGSERSYQLRHRIYKLTDKQLAVDESIEDLIQLAVADSVAEESNKVAKQKIEELSRRVAGSPPSQDVAAACRFVLGQSTRARREAMLQQILFQAPRTDEEVMGLVRRYAIVAVPLEYHRLPMTMMADDEEFALEFHPDVASRLFEAWRVVDEYLAAVTDDSTARVLSSDKPSDLPLLQRLLEAYARRYVAYWSGTVRGRSVPGSILNRHWSEFRNQLSRLKVYYVNEQLRDSTKQIRDALAVALPTPAVAEKVKNLIKLLDLELERLKSERFAEVCKSANYHWGSLNDDETAARRALLATPIGMFVNKYLEPYSEDPEQPGAAYWNSLYLTSLYTLATSAEAEAGDALRQLIHTYKGFPLCWLHRDIGSLDALQIKTAFLGIRRIQRLAAAGNVEGPDKPIGAGARTGFKLMDEQLDRLLGWNLLQGGDAQWFDQVAVILEALVGGDETLFCELRVLAKGDQQAMTPGGEMNAFKIFRTLEVHGDRGLIDSRQNTDPLEQVVVATVPVTDVGKIRLMFFKGLESKQGEQADARVILDGPWAAIRAIHRNDTQHDERTGRWRVRLDIPDGHGRDFPYWLEFAFSRPLPAPDIWPQLESWPNR